jgi:hypothetical protein
MVTCHRPCNGRPLGTVTLPLGSTPVGESHGASPTVSIEVPAGAVFRRLL